MQRLSGFGAGGRELIVHQAPDSLVRAAPNFAEIERLFFATAFNGWGAQMSGITSPYRQHVWVHACINAIAQNIAGVPLNFYTGTKKDKRLVETGPLVKLFETPNPMMSGFQLIEATMIFLGIAGEAFYILDRPNITALPQEIWTFHPSRFEHVPGENGVTKGWIYRKGSKQIPLLPHEVLFIRYFNPDDDYRGLSPIQAAKVSVDQDFYAAQYNRNFFLNSAQPGGVLESKENLIQEEFERLLAQWNDRHQGVDKVGKIALLEGGVTYKTTGISQRDMDFLEGRKYNREEILAVYKVPKGEIGVEDDTGSYAKDKVRRKLFWETTLDPKMTLIEYVLWSQLCQGIAGPEVWPEFDRKSIAALQEDRGLLIEQMRGLCGIGYPANVVNEWLDLGLPSIPGGDIGYIPFNQVPMGETGTPPLAAAPGVTPGNGKGKTLPQRLKTIPATIEDMRRLSLPSPSLTIIARRTITRRAFWQQYHQLQSAFEKKFQGRMKRFFYDQRREQLRLIEQHYGKSIQGQVRATADEVDALLFPLDAWNENLKKISWTFYQSVGEEAGKALVAELGADPDKFILADTPAIEILKDKLKKIEEINDITYAKLKDTLMEGMVEIETVHELQARVREVYNFTESRSLTIARTETGQAAAPARAAAMEMLGVTRQEWTTAGDNDVRDIHASMDGEIVDVGELFSNGLAYPCDPAGDAEEVINCRCVSAPVIEKD